MVNVRSEIADQTFGDYSDGLVLEELKRASNHVDWSLNKLHARAITFQLAEVAVTGPMVRAILAAIRRLREPPLCA